ncbi:MAG: sulfatase [Planctomycetota bacterium]
MSRQILLVFIFLALICESGWLSAAYELQVRPNDNRPNVVMIIVDDLNDWIGCLSGHPQAKTPNIDRLAKQGILFSNAHCQGPICGPSRCSFLSGKYPFTTGVYQQPQKKELESDEKFFRGHLIPEYFAKHGYATTGVGKVTHGYREEIAFQKFGGEFEKSGPKPPDNRRFHFRPPDHPFIGTQTDWGAYPESDGQMPDFKSASYAINFLSQNHDAPFFLAVGLVRPHVPFYVPKKWMEMFPEDKIQLPRFFRDDLDDVPQISQEIHELPNYPNLEFLQANDNQQFRKCVQAYLACTAFVDHQVGRILKQLNHSKHSENTVVVFLSDHGYHLGEKDRVSKHSLWEESTRVPLIVVPAQNQIAQNKFKTGSEVKKPVGLIDVYPTLLDLCRLPPKRTNEGYSLRLLMEDPKMDWQFGVLTTYARGCHSLRTDQHRYIQYENGDEELYDHSIDPDEWENLAGLDEYGELVARCRIEVPSEGAKYHPSVSAAPVNEWFRKHFERNGLTVKNKKR